MARPIIKRGPEITPRRRAIIVGYRMLSQPLSYREIKKKLGVAESTASGIFRHAIKNATSKRLEEQAIDLQHALPMPYTPSAEPEDFLAGINAELQALQIIGGGTNDCSFAPQVAPAQLQAGPDLDSEFTLLELISKDCLDPDGRSGRPNAMSEEDKDRLVATVKRDFNTRRMKLVDLRREAGLSHVCDTTVYNALQERGIKAYREEFKFILSPDFMDRVRHMCGVKD